MSCAACEQNKTKKALAKDAKHSPILSKLQSNSQRLFVNPMPPYRLALCAGFYIGIVIWKEGGGELGHNYCAGVHNAKAEECTTPYMRQNIKINIGVGGLLDNQFC